MGTCRICAQSSSLTATFPGVCAACVHTRRADALSIARAHHAKSRQEFGLPSEPPRNTSGVRCPLCINECLIAEGKSGYCGLRTMRSGRLVHLAGTPKRGLLHWYRDPLPTNCVADWVCPGQNAYGFHNLAVFYTSCTFNCQFCQNWHFRQVPPTLNRGISAQELAGVANHRTFCACYFGGDPASQMPHALAAGRLLGARGVRVCWETNGSMHPKLLVRALELSLATGGCIKFDLKAYDDGIHLALTGTSNRCTLENFAVAAKRSRERPEPPLLVASTLLVPGYVDAAEVGAIARFIAELNPHIPYALLAFAPNFYMSDLPRTSARHAQEAEAAACSAGLINVRVGNRHLLSREY